MKRYLWTIGDWILFCLTYFSAISSLIPLFLSGGGTMTQREIMMGLILCLVFTVLFYGYKVQKVKNSFRRKATDISLQYHEISHSMRDERYNIIRASLDNSISQKLLDEIFERVTLTTVNALSDMLSCITGVKVSVSIKFFENNEADIRNATVRNLVSCKNTHRDRINSNTRNKITAITEFREIMVGDRNFFHCSDLFKDEAYTNPSDWRKYYRTKMVFPIRTIEEKTSDGTIKYQVLGFICADAPKAGCFSADLQLFEGLICSIADNLYSCFYDYRHYSAMIEKCSRKGEVNEISGVGQATLQGQVQGISI